MLAIAINGFGRIGKTLLRILLTDKEALKNIKVVAINIGPNKREFVSLLFKYDTIMKTFNGSVSQNDDELIVNGTRIKLLSESDPATINWKKYAVDWIVDCSGKFTKGADAKKHLNAGAAGVLISAPASDEDIAIIPGVNDALFDKKKHKIVSLGSCTTNAVFPLLKILYDSCGLEQASLLTTHAYTNSQVLIDIEDKDPRLSRAAALNIIPASTGAAKMVQKIMPELVGKVEMNAIRVPVATVSLLEITFTTSKKFNAEQLNTEIKKSASGKFKGIVDSTAEPLVSSDFSGVQASVTVDTLLTKAFGSMATVFGWYDNESGYSARLKDFLLLVSKN